MKNKKDASVPETKLMGESIQTGRVSDRDLNVGHEACMNTLPIPLTEPFTQGRCRFVYDCGMDGSDLPYYLLWPASIVRRALLAGGLIDIQLL